MKRFTDAVPLSDGWKAFVDLGEPETPDPAEFELKHSAIVGDKYSIVDQWQDEEHYYYLGHGWSATPSIGMRIVYVTPSHRPHYRTRESDVIPADVVADLIRLINSVKEPDFDYEMD